MPINLLHSIQNNLYQMSSMLIIQNETFSLALHPLVFRMWKTFFLLKKIRKFQIQGICGFEFYKV